MGYELWATDGTAEGTRLVKDLLPGAGSSYPGNLVDVGGVLYFTANAVYNKLELWRTDGTEPGTVKVKDLAVSYAYEFTAMPGTAELIGDPRRPGHRPAGCQLRLRGGRHPERRHGREHSRLACRWSRCGTTTTPTVDRVRGLRRGRQQRPGGRGSPSHGFDLQRHPGLRPSATTWPSRSTPISSNCASRTPRGWASPTTRPRCRSSR